MEKVNAIFAASEIERRRKVAPLMMEIYHNTRHKSLIQGTNAREFWRLFNEVHPGLVRVTEDYGDHFLWKIAEMTEQEKRNAWW